MSGRRQERSSSGRSKSRRITRRGQRISAQEVENVLVFERRVLIVFTVLTLLGSMFWIVAISTDHWYAVESPTDQGIYVAVPEKESFMFVRSDVGLWRACNTQRSFDKGTNTTGDKETKCDNHNMFPSRKDVAKNLIGKVDHTYLDYARTDTAFAIIAMILMIMGHGFSCYTFVEQRYMFKRLAGGVHILTAATCVVVVEVLNSSAKHAEAHLPFRNPPGSSWHFGFSFILAWMSFVIFLTAGIAFFVCSRKRKGVKLPSGTDDDPHILGRA